MTYFKIVLIFIFFGFIQTGNAQSYQSPESATDSTYRETTKSDYSQIKEVSDLKFQLLDTENLLREQRTYKFVFMATSLFILLLAVFAMVVFYIRARKTAEILELQNREIMLRENKLRQLSVILDNVETPLIITDKTGNIQCLNRAFTSYYDFNIEELKAQNKTNFIEDICTTDEKARVQEAIDKKLAVNYPVDSGLGGQLSRTIFPIPDSDGKTMGLGIIDNAYKNPSWLT